MSKQKSNILVQVLAGLLKSALANKGGDISLESSKYKEKPAKPKPSECILIIDIATTCWKDATEMCANNPKQKHEILELAITPITLKDLSIGDTDTYIIKPRQEHSISELCTSITGLTNEICSDGIDIEDAFSTIKKKYKDKKVSLIATFGLYDLKMIKWQCDKLKLEYPFPGGFMDIKRLVSMTMGLEGDISLGEAMQAVGIKYDKRLPKRAQLDSRRAAKVLTKIWGAARAKSTTEQKKPEIAADIIVPDRILVLN